MFPWLASGFMMYLIARSFTRDEIVRGLTRIRCQMLYDFFWLWTQLGSKVDDLRKRFRGTNYKILSAEIFFEPDNKSVSVLGFIGPGKKMLQDPEVDRICRKELSPGSKAVYLAIKFKDLETDKTHRVFENPAEPLNLSWFETQPNALERAKTPKVQTAYLHNTRTSNVHDVLETLLEYQGKYSDFYAKEQKPPILKWIFRQELEDFQKSSLHGFDELLIKTNFGEEQVHRLDSGVQFKLR